MTDFVQYLVDQVINEKLSKDDAVNLLRQYEERNCTKVIGELHPLLHQNISTLLEQRFSSTFNGDEFFLTGNATSNQKILPGVAYLEIFRAAVEEAMEIDTQSNSFVTELENVLWSPPLVVGTSEVTLHTSLFAEADGSISIELYSGSGMTQTEPIVYGQCRAVVPDQIMVDKVINIDEQKRQCNLAYFSHKDWYSSIKTTGLTVALGSQVIDEVFVGDAQILVKLIVSSPLTSTLKDIVVHPNVLDGALQAVNGLSLIQNVQQPSSHLVPISLEKLTISHPCSTEMWALIRATDKSAQGFVVDIELCDFSGRVGLQLKGFALRELPNAIGAPVVAADLGGLLLQPQWQIHSIDTCVPLPYYGSYQVLVCESDDQFVATLQTRLSNYLDTVDCIGVSCKQGDIGSRYSQFASQVFEQVQTILKSKPKAPVLVQVVIPCGLVDGESELFAGVAGILKSAHLENPKLIGQVIEIDGSLSAELVVEQLLENRYTPAVSQIRYQKGQREVLAWREVEAVASSISALGCPWKDRGVYWITGGAGGLGVLFAKDIAQRTEQSRIILTGRSALDEKKAAQLHALRAQGAEVSYQIVDITDQTAVVAFVEDIQKRFGALNGIIHSAGVIRDNFIIKKTVDEFGEVLSPKVQGLVNLDQATKETALNFLVVFSSMAGFWGNAGQADYAAGNMFMDIYAHYRNSLVAKGHRQGQTISINWPLWKHGGMQMDVYTEQAITQNTGCIAMSTETGINAFYQVLSRGGDQWAVVEGFVPIIREELLGSSNFKESMDNIQLLEDSSAPVDIQRLREKTLYRVKGLFGDVVKMDINKLDSDEPLESYGIDSIMITRLNRQLNEIFGELSKTLFYEYQTLAELTEYFITEQASACLQWTGLDNQADVVEPKLRAESLKALTNVNAFPCLVSFRSRTANSRSDSSLLIKQEVSVIAQSQCESIAIIGLSGRYPHAKDLNEYWDNLAAGKDCICEIPPERWSLDGFYVEDLETAVEGGKSYSKWGGFIEGFDDFDPLFFKISPREAIIMDPQERLFLQCCWEVLEDAGYTKEQLEEKYDRRVGVFVGITKTGHELYGHDSWKRGSPVYPHTSFSSTANRISYFLNLQGPSMPIDTMCSSSLVAIYEACNRIRQQECEMAIAGGVNLYLHPSSYIKLSAGRLISDSAICAAFGKEGNGFVPGEGVGCVLLKPLSIAEKDRDHIYAVILGSHTNHNGKTNGYLVPNPTAQYSLFLENLQRSGIDPRTISYVEAAANGSAMGDPIELNALSKAFAMRTEDKGFCAIGSVKPNIGHLEAASGISQLTKVILQLQHKQLVPSIHAESLNPNLSFANSPFYLQRELQEWKRPVIKRNGELQKFPRRATISSFGAGGVNAHLIIEEYSGIVSPSVVGNSSNKKNIQIDLTTIPQIITFSAKNNHRLQSFVEKMINFLEHHKLDDICKLSLVNIAYTLQVGREAMEARLAIVANNVEELIQSLKNYLLSKTNSKELESNIPIFEGNLEEDSQVARKIISGDVGKSMLKLILEERDMEKIALLWTLGSKIPWESLHDSGEVQRISLPVYAFEEQSYWIVDELKKNGILDSLTEIEIGDQRSNKVGLKRELQKILSEYKTNKHSLESTVNRIRNVFS